MVKKILVICTSILTMFTVAVIPVFAHVIVTPQQVGVAATQDFTVNVPNEKDNPVTAVRLLIPDGVTSVVPDAVPGWTIATKSNGSGDNTNVTEIDWNGGSIPVGQRAEFVFQAQVPPKPTTLAWKAYQTYSDGTVVSWDVDPAAMKNMSDEQQDAMADKENKGVYSTTTVINDLTGAQSTQSQNTNMASSGSTQSMLPLWFSIIAIALSAVSLSVSLRRKQ